MPRTSLVFRRAALVPMLAFALLLAALAPAAAQADPALPTISVAPPALVLAEQDIAVTGTGEPGAEIQVKVDDADEGPRITVGLDGTWEKTDVPTTFGSSTVVADEYVDDVFVGTSNEVTVTGLFAFAFADSEVDPIFEIYGDATPGSTIVVKDETNQVIATLITTECGCIDQPTTVPLAPGAHTLTYTATLSGVTTPVGDPIEVVVRPPAPVLASPVDGEIVDAGVVHFTGTAEPGATIKVTAALLGQIATGTADEHGDYDVSTASLDPATLSVTVTQTLDGAESEPTAPATVIVAYPAPTLTYDGPSTVAGGDPLPVSGTGHPGSSISIQINGTEAGTTTVLGDGTWSGSVEAVDGINTLTAVQDGVRPSDPPVDVMALYRPEIDSPDDGATVPGIFRIDGNAYPDEEVVAVDENDDPFGSATPDPCGCFSITNTTPLADGPHTITLTQVVDGTPLVRRLHVIVDHDAMAVLSPRNGDFVEEGLNHFTGTGKPGATIDLYDEDGDEDPIGTTTVGLDGTFDLTATLVPGPVYLAVVQTIDGVPGPATRLALYVLIPPPTIQIDGATTVREGDPIHLSGTARPDAHVVIQRNGSPVDDTTADEDGDWSYDLPAENWDNYIDAFQVAGGDVSFPSDQVHATGVGAPALYTPADGDYVSPLVDMSGAGVPDSTVTVTDEDEQVLGTAVPSETGYWSLITTVPLDPGTHTLHLTQELDGVTGPETTVDVKVRPDAPTLTAPTGNVVNPVHFIGTGTPGAEVAVYEAGTTTDPLASGIIGLDGAFDLDATLPYGDQTYDVIQNVGGADSLPASAAIRVLLNPPALNAPPTVTSGDTVDVTGTAMPGATVELLRNMSLVDTVTADGLGDWVAHFTAIDGDNYIAASQTLGDDSSPVSEETLVIGVGQPYVATPQEGDDVSPLFTLSGYGLAGAEITVENAIGAPIGTGTVAGDGTWDVTTTVPLSGGTQVVHVTQLFNGTTSPATDRSVNVIGPVPVNVTLPAITTATATPAVGVRLVRTLGTWTNVPTGYGYQWQRCNGAGASCANVPGETGATYLPTASDAGSTFRVAVTASNTYGPSLPATSAASGVVTAQVPSLATAPTVPTTTAPSPSVGVRLVRNAGTWNGPVTSYAYQWQRCNGSGTGCTNIAGETATSYLPVASDAGSTFRVSVTAHNDVGDSLPALSPTTAVVTQPVPTVVTAPAAPTTTTIAPTVGVRLNRTLGTWTGTPTSYAYQWQRCNGSGGSCSDVAGETGTTYKPVSSDVGSTFRVAVTASNAGGASQPAVSDATDPVIAPVPVSTGTPPAPTTTAPSPVVGVRLVRVTGSWSGVPTSYTYQWRRCNGSGASCSDIAGETGTSYMPVLSDVGSTFRVTIVAHNDAGSSLPATSDATAAVTQPPPSIVTPPSTTVSLPVAGVRLTRTLGTWTGTPTSYAYQWQICDASGNGCTDIPGATGATYKVLPADVGSTFRVLVTASNAAGPSEPAASAPTLAAVASSGT